MVVQDTENIKIDVEEVKKLYGVMSELVNADLLTQYKEKKINGATYAKTWTQLMDAVVAGTMNTIAQLQMKETDHDRCIKEEQCASSQAATTNDTCRATADCKVKDEQAKHIIEQAKQTIEQTELTKTQEAEIKIESCRKDGLTEAEHKLKTVQANKAEYERNNILPASLQLTNRQVEGFDDNINIKVMESKWSYNAMITASGIGDGGYLDVTEPGTAGYTKLPSNSANASESFDTDECSEQ